MVDSEVAADSRLGPVEDLLMTYSRQDKCMKFSRNYERGQRMMKKKKTTGKMRGEGEREDAGEPETRKVSHQSYTKLIEVSVTENGGAAGAKL